MNRSALCVFAVLASGCGQGTTPGPAQGYPSYFGNALSGDLAFPVRSAWLTGRSGGGADNRASGVTIVLTDVPLTCREEPLEGSWPETAHRLRLQLYDNGWLATGHVIDFPGDAQDGGANSTAGYFDHQTFSMYPAEDGGWTGSFDLRLLQAQGTATITHFEEPPYQFWVELPSTQIAGTFELDVPMPNGGKSHLSGSFDAGFCKD